MTDSHPRPSSLDRSAPLTSAVAGVVDAGLPELTWVDAGLPNSQKRKTNPPPSQPVARAPATHPNRDARPRGPALGAVDTGLPELTPVNAGLPNRPNCKTNPPSPAGPDSSLSDRKLVAARLFAWGRTVTQVASELGITRQALWKWRRNPAFAGEVRRIHERISLRPLAAPRT